MQFAISALFAARQISDCNIPQAMEMFKKKTGRKTVKGTKKLLGFMKAKNIFLYTPMICWHLHHGLRLTALHQLI